MNNQLIDSQRALVRSNQRLKKALADIQNAHDRIAALELDSLTGLWRSAAFYPKVERWLAKNPKKPCEMIALNIAHFAMLNELFGRAASRRLLQELALFLTSLDQDDQGVLSREGMDVFYIFMPGEPRFHTRLQEALPHFFEAYPLPVHLCARIGVCSSEGMEVHAEQLCNRARLALDTVQEEDPVQIAFYDRSLHEKLLMEHRILDSVQDALERREFQLYLQPKVDMRTRQPVGAEALIRWIHPEMGFISPGQFIPLLEREGLIYKVDRYIWEEACKFLQAWREHGLSQLPLSINLARADFYQKDLLDVLDQLLRKYDLSPKLLHLEVIERAYTDDTKKIFEVLTRLRERGFSIEMDDFGVGASSLSMAAEMPVDVLKLDRSFVCTCVENPKQAKVVQFIIELAKMLEVSLIAEGVETQEQADLLCSMGCSYAQGYLYSKPRPAQEFLRTNA